MYCDYFKLYKIISDFIVLSIADKKLLDLISVNDSYPVYKDLEPFKEYDLEIIQSIHEIIVVFLSAINNFLMNKVHDLQVHKMKNDSGYNIDNFINTFNFNNIVLKEKLRLFITYIEFFHQLHARYLTRLTEKITLFCTQLNDDIKFDENAKPQSKPPPKSPADMGLFRASSYDSGENFIVARGVDMGTIECDDDICTDVTRKEMEHELKTTFGLEQVALFAMDVKESSISESIVLKAEVPVEVVVEVPVDVSEEVVVEVPVDVSEEVVDEVPVDVSEEVVDEVRDEVVVEVTVVVPGEVTVEVTVEVPVEIISVDVPLQVTVEVPVDVPVEVPVEIISVDVPLQVTEEVPDEVPLQVTDEVPDEEKDELVFEEPTFQEDLPKPKRKYTPRKKKGE